MLRCGVVHQLPFVSVRKTRAYVLWNFVVKRAITLTNKSSIFITELIEHFIQLRTLRTLLLQFLNVTIVYYLLYICHARTFLTMIFATEGNGALWHFLSLATLAYIIPTQVRNLLYHYKTTVTTYKLTHL